MRRVKLNGLHATINISLIDNRIPKRQMNIRVIIFQNSRYFSYKSCILILFANSKYDPLKFVRTLCKFTFLSCLTKTISWMN